jgi:outer membrane protein assembly factor BamB
MNLIIYINNMSDKKREARKACNSVLLQGFSNISFIISQIVIVLLRQKWASTAIGNQIGSSPAIANGFVYIGSDDGKLYAFSLPGV